MRRALRKIDPSDHNIYAQTVAIAQQHLAEEPLEYGGNNCGPWVRLYMTGKDGAAQKWCAGFVCTIVAQSARDFGIPMPINRQVGVDFLVKDAKSANRFIAEAKVRDTVTRRSKLPSGCVFVRRKTRNDWDHTGFLLSIENDHFTTIEGNAAKGNSNDGVAASSRTRHWRSYDFVLLS